MLVSPLTIIAVDTNETSPLVLGRERPYATVQIFNCMWSRTWQCVWDVTVRITVKPYVFSVEKLLFAGVQYSL